MPALPPEFTTPLPVPPREDIERMYWTDLLSMQGIANHYGVGLGTVHKWMHQLGITTRSNGTPALTRMHHGLKQRHCKGVTHPEGEWLPEQQFHSFRKQGRRLRRRECMACNEASGMPLPRIPLTRNYRAWLTSIVNRVGKMEASRRLGVHDKTLRAWTGLRPPKTIHRRHARRIVTLMRELRESGEVRHRKSIRSGGAIRGFPERVPRTNRDYYKPHGDEDTEGKRRRRSLTGK